jgi:hypothetical protein
MSLITKARDVLIGSSDEQHANLAAKLATAQAELAALATEHGRLALAAESGDPAAAARLATMHKVMAAKKLRIADLQSAVSEHEARAAEEAAKARAKARVQFEAEGREALAAVHAAAVEVDKKMDVFAATVAQWVSMCEAARPYLNDEGMSALYRASLPLRTCLDYRLRACPGFPGNPELTNPSLEAWAQHVPGANDAGRLLSNPK